MDGWGYFASGRLRVIASSANHCASHLAAALLLSTLAGAQTPSAPVPNAFNKSTAAGLLDLALQKRLYFALPGMLEHAPGLPSEKLRYFQGILAFHGGRFEDARKDLTAALNANPTSLTSEQKIEAFRTLGENARLTHLYGACAQMYSDIDRIWGAKLGAAEQDTVQNRHFCAVQQHTSPQTIRFTTSFTLHPRGREYPVQIGKAAGLAFFDTGATESVVLESVAKSWGITPGEATVAMHGYSGGEFAGHPAVLPELTIGTAVLQNVAVIVVPDAAFASFPAEEQFHALLGLPVLLALGRLTYARDGSLTVSPAATANPAKASAPLWFGDSQLLVQLRTQDATGQSFHYKDGDEQRLFSLDTGSRDSYLTDHYFREHQSLFTGPPPATAKLAGAGGEIDTAAYIADHQPLWCGDSVLFLNGPHVLTAPQPGVIENFEGLLGRDVLGTLKNYTIDLRAMRLTIEP